MEIIYPALVEQVYSFCKENGLEVTKEDIYKMQVKEGLITQTGEPTQKSFDEGLVVEFNQQHDTLKQFKKEFTVFSKYEKEEFAKQDGIWYVSQNVLEETTKKMEFYNNDEIQQIDIYLNYRSYENPHRSIAESKGVYHPLYTKYADSDFQIIDGRVAVPKHIVEDIILRSKTGELKCNDEQLNDLIEMMNGMEGE